MTFGDASPPNLHVIVGSANSLETAFDLFNSVATAEGDVGFCGAYQCSLANQDSSALHSFLSGTLSADPNASDNEKWILELDSASASSSDV